MTTLGELTVSRRSRCLTSDAEPTPPECRDDLAREIVARDSVVKRHGRLPATVAQLYAAHGRLRAAHGCLRATHSTPPHSSQSRMWSGRRSLPQTLPHAGHFHGFL